MSLLKNASLIVGLVLITWASWKNRTPQARWLWIVGLLLLVPSAIDFVTGAWAGLNDGFKGR